MWLFALYCACLRGKQDQGNQPNPLARGGVSASGPNSGYPNRNPLSGPLPSEDLAVFKLVRLFSVNSGSFLVTIFVGANADCT